MIKSLRVTNYLGDTLNIPLRDSFDTGFLIRKIDGLGPAKADINVTNITTNDGANFNSAHLQTRNIVITLEFFETPTIEDARLKTYKYFPIKKPVELVIETDRRVGRIKGYVESNEPDIFSNKEMATISIICPNPYFYADGVNTTVFYGIQPLFEFPFSNESLTEPLIEFSSINNYQERNIYYDGDAEVGIIMKLFAGGDVGDISIYNLTSKEAFHIDSKRLEQLTGYPMKEGDEITIVTMKGEKRVTLLRDGLYYNILNAMVRKSSWFQLSKGDNVFTFTASEGASNLQFTIDSYKLYEGM